MKQDGVWVEEMRIRECRWFRGSIEREVGGVWCGALGDEE